MILIWFNPRLEKFYTKFYKHYVENKFYVGFKNSYDHEVVQIIIFGSHDKYYSVYDYCDYYIRSRRINKNKKLINSLKSFLDRK